MRVGDLLEWAALALATGAAYLATHLAWPAMTVAALGLGYQAQCYSAHRLRLRKKRTKGAK